MEPSRPSRRRSRPQPRASFAVFAWPLTAAVAVALLVSPAGAHNAPTRASAPPTPAQAAASASPARRASLDVALVLAALPLPSGSTHSAGEPAGAGSDLARPGCLSVYDCTTGEALVQHLVQTGGWWVVPGTPAQTLAYIDAYRPKSWGLSTSGTTGYTRPNPPTPTLTFQTFTLPAVGTTLTDRQVAIGAVALSGGTTAIRVDAQEIYNAPRPTSALIPTPVKTVTIQVIHEPIDGNGHTTRSHPITVTDPHQVRTLITRIDGLLFDESTGPKSCPAFAGAVFVMLSFLAPHSSAPLATLRIDPLNCFDARLTIGREKVPGLIGGSTLVAQIEGAAHVHLTGLEG
jgi:hypothetical protein